MHTIHLTRTLYIEREDFRFEDSGDYYGLAPGKTAGLRYGGFVKVAQVVKDEAGNVSGPVRAPRRRLVRRLWAHTPPHQLSPRQPCSR